MMSTLLPVYDNKPEDEITECSLLNKICSKCIKPEILCVFKPSLTYATFLFDQHDLLCKIFLLTLDFEFTLVLEQITQAF